MRNVRGFGDGSPPVGSRGEAPVKGLGDLVPQKLKHIYLFLGSRNSKILLFYFFYLSKGMHSPNPPQDIVPVIKPFV